MGSIAYSLAAVGFMEAGWSTWRAIWWPSYLAKKLGGKHG